MTMAEKILARTSGRSEVHAGDYVVAKPDVAMMHFAAAGVYVNLMRAGVDKIVFNPDKIVVVLDHYVPAPTVREATIHNLIRSAMKEWGVKNFYDVKAGICHQVLPEKGHVKPGELIVGTDSHTTTYGAFGAAGTGIGTTDMAIVLATGELWFMVPETIKFNITGKLPERVMSKDVIIYIAGKYTTEVAQYKSIEFYGPTVEEMTIASRMTMSNMAMEIGAKFAFFEPDDKVIGYVNNRTHEPFTPVKSDADASYEEVYNLDVSNMEPQVACPYSVGNVKPVSEVEGTKINQAFLGSCTNGRFEDLKIAAEILKGKKIHHDVRMLIYPASWETYQKALRAGFLEIFIDAGAVVCNAACGPCFGAMGGLLGDGEKCVASINRNFVGRMGAPSAEVYLASPATVAASASTGVITDPRKV